MKVAVIGLGKIGLPLAVQIAGSGVVVIGVDRNPEVVVAIDAGRAPFPGEAGLEERLASVRSAGMFEITLSTPGAVAEVDIVVVVVPLVVDHLGEPDFSSIDSATEGIGSALRPGQTVIYETTLPVGTTRERLSPILEQTSGLIAGSDFFLAYSPERVSSGTVFSDLRRYPKLVGGINGPSTDAASDFYSRVLEFDERPDLARPNGVWNLGSADAAEFAKLAETTYRDVNIALANEFAVNAEGRNLDLWDIIDAANSQPFSHIHRPGIAVGGHCIPVYPHLYLRGHERAILPAAARRVNMEQPERGVANLERLMGSIRDKKVVVLGAAYRRGVKETAFSGVFALVAAIESRGGRCVVHDPLYSAAELVALGLVPCELGDPVDGAIVQTDHEEYRVLLPHDLPGCRAIVDGRGVLSLRPWEDAGIAAYAVGRPLKSQGML